MTAPEVPHADLIAELRESADGLEYLSDSPWVRAMLNRAADALAALGDTVPREEALRQMRADRFSEGWTAAHAHFAPQIVTAERERDEARAERDALAHVIEQARALPHNEIREGDGHVLFVDAYQLSAILDAAPAVSLAQHDAEVKAQALDEASRFTTEASFTFENLADVRDWLRARAAAIREEVK